MNHISLSLHIILNEMYHRIESFNCYLPHPIEKKNKKKTSSTCDWTQLLKIQDTDNNQWDQLVEKVTYNTVIQLSFNSFAVIGCQLYETHALL